MSMASAHESGIGTNSRHQSARSERNNTPGTSTSRDTLWVNAPAEADILHAYFADRNSLVGLSNQKEMGSSK